MFSEEMQSRIDAIDIKSLMGMQDHMDLFNEFKEISLQPNPDIILLEEKAHDLIDQCNLISESIQTISDAYNEDPDAMNHVIEDLNLPFFWNVIEELSNTVRLELLAIGMVLGKVKYTGE